ncbi:MAG: ATP-binding protein [Bacteroidia bacterium]|nr:ATP-binding protein [Bacteroidia bacterium]
MPESRREPGTHPPAHPPMTHPDDLDRCSREELADLCASLMRQQQQQAREVQELREELAQRPSAPDLLPMQRPLAAEDMRAVIENTGDFVLSLGRDYRIRVVNGPMRRLMLSGFGIDPQAGQRIEDLFPVQMTAPWMPIIERAFEGEEFHTTYEFSLDGAACCHEISFKPIRNASGEVAAAGIFSRDITEKHLALREILLHKRMLEAINYSIKEGIFRTTPDQGLVYVNKAFIEMFGYDSEDEIRQVDINDLYVDPARRAYFVEYMETHNHFTNQEVEFRRKDGTSFWGLMSSIKTVDEQGNVYRDGAIRDVTVLRQAEIRLREQNDELRKVNQELDSFVYRTSHDLKAPLDSIRGLVSVVHLAQNDQERMRYLDLISSSIDKLDGFIQDIIGYSRNSRLPLHREKIDFHLLITNSFEALQYLEGSQQLEKRIRISGEGPFYSDPHRLEIIFKNMFANAIRYSDRGKPQSFVEVEVALTPGAADILISDNGIGIDPAIISRIFEMFYRGTKISKGSGIGLYIVRETIAKLQGEISVTSEPGKWTRFHLHLPEVQAADPSA